MKNLKKLSRENLKSVKGGILEGCPGPKSPLYPYPTKDQCESKTGQVCYYEEESRCFPAGWHPEL